MRIIVLAFVVAAAFVIGANGGAAPGTANACSCGPECEDVVHNADLIVEGRITDWQRTDGYTSPGTYLPIILRMEVLRVFKGTVPPRFALVDHASLYSPRLDGTEEHWSGAGGACGSFDEDPKGLWVIAALYRDEFGNYRMGRPATVFLGSEPGGPHYDFVVSKLTQNVGPPATGTGAASHRAEGNRDTLYIWSATLIAVGICLWLSSWRRSQLSPL